MCAGVCTSVCVGVWQNGIDAPLLLQMLAHKAKRRGFKEARSGERGAVRCVRAVLGLQKPSDDETCQAG